MQRVVKRFLMHNQGDSDDPKQNEFDELKQDLQVMRYEILNDMKKSREENNRNMHIINAGMEFVAEEMMKSNSEDLNEIDKATFRQFLRYKEVLNTHQSNFTRIESTTSASSCTLDSDNTDDLFVSKRRSSSISFSDSSERLEDTPLPKDSIEFFNNSPINKYSTNTSNLHKIVEEPERSNEEISSKILNKN